MTARQRRYKDRAKPAPKPKPATGPIRVVTGEPDF